MDASPGEHYMEMLGTMPRQETTSEAQAPLAQATPQRSPSSMPDIANQGRSTLTGTLDWVGMSDIEVPVRLANGSLVPARAEAFVSLDDPDAKGIHMSRLFLALQTKLEEEVLSVALMESIIERFVASHKDLSKRARVELSFDLPLKRPALISDNVGWRSYPATMVAEHGPEGVRVEMGVRITYSSTCPCSAALARQLIQERFDRDFAQRGDISPAEFRTWLGREDAICATPHSQRSHADVEVHLTNGVTDFDHEALINLVEGALKTPVQAAVKREDEQEFARLNGENLMFCEDAGRRLTAALGNHDAIFDFRARASHRESLHPHDAVSVVTKGVEGGFRP